MQSSSSERSSDPRIGQVIDGRYRIRECIGAGGMGVVYLAERERIGRPVAIKFLRDTAASEPRFVRRFEVEARALGRLQHPHCVTVMDFGVADVPYIVMQYVPGPTLRDELKGGPLPVARCLSIARQLLAGLEHAHERGIIHRDIKPENVTLEEVTGTGSHVRLLDFGLAKLRDAVTWMPPSNPFITVGTPSYMSPEQFAGNKIDARSDIYSTGAMLFELLTGRKPFEFEEPRDGFAMHRDWPRPRLRRIAPDAGFSAELEAVVLRAMSKSPADRFQSASEFSKAIAATPEANPTVSSVPKDEHTARVQTTGSRLGKLVLLALFALAAAAAIAFAVTQRGSPGAVSPALAVPADQATEIHAPAAAERADDQLDPETLVRRADAHFAKSRWSRAIPLYRKAIRLDPALRQRRMIHENAIRALRGKRSHRKAAQLIEHELGTEAIPYLERAARDSKSSRIRRRANRLLTVLSEQDQ